MKNRIFQILLISLFLSSCVVQPKQEFSSTDSNQPTLPVIESPSKTNPSKPKEKDQDGKAPEKVVVLPFQETLENLVPIRGNTISDLKEIGNLDMGGERNITSVDISEDRRLLVMIDRNLRIILWDLPAGKIIYERTVPAGVDHSTDLNQILFSPDHALFAIGLLDGIIYVWNTGAGEIKEKFNANPGITGQVNALAFSPDGKQLVAAYDHDKSVRIWDIEKNMQTHLFYANPCSGRSISFSLDGNFVALGSSIGSVNGFDLDHGKSFSYDLNVSSTSVGMNQNLLEISYGRNSGSLFIAQINQGITQIWRDFPSGSPEQVVSFGNEGNKIIFSSDGVLMIGLSRNKAGFWLISSGEKVRTIEIPSETKGWITNARMSGDNRLFVTSSVDGIVRLWGVMKMMK